MEGLAVNRTIWKLTADHIIRNRRSSLLELITLILAATAYFICVLSYGHYAEVYMEWCHEQFGDWYAFAEVPDEGSDLARYYLESRIGRYETITEEDGSQHKGGPEDMVRYGYLFVQGEYQGYTVGCAQEALYDLCRLPKPFAYLYGAYCKSRRSCGGRTEAPEYIGNTSLVL